MQHTSIFSVLFDLNSCLIQQSIDPTKIGILMLRDDFEAFRDAVRKEHPGELWNTGNAFNYAGLTFLDGGAYVYAKAEKTH